MKKIFLVLFLLIFSIQGFGQNSNGLEPTNGIDFLILEMKLGAVLGGYKDGKFVNAKTAEKGIKINEEYTLFGFDVDNKDGILKLTKKNDSMDDICPEFVSVETSSKIKNGVALSSNARWNATPRIPKSINPNSKVYRGLVGKYLVSKGLSNPNVEIKKIYRVDLEGDGVNEVIIHASNRPGRPGFQTKKGEYSFIMMRKLINGKIKSLFISGEIVTKNIENSIPYNFELSGILDLDGDGKMEIVTYGEYYEGAWSEAFEIDGEKATKVLETGCGV